MSESDTKPHETLELVDIDITRASLDFIKEQMSDCLKQGKYNFDDAQKIIISTNNIYKALETLSKLQVLALKIKNHQEKTPPI